MITATAAPDPPDLPRIFFDNLGSFAETPEGVAKLRELILDLAVRGKLVEQDENDEPASELLVAIDEERVRLIDEKAMRKPKALPPIEADEIKYALPDSWRWTRLENTFYSISPGKKKLKTSEFLDVGPIPVVDQGQSFIAGYTDQADMVTHIPGPVVVFGDHTCELKLVDFDFVAGADGIKILRPNRVDVGYFHLALRGLRLEDRGYSRHFKVLVDNLFPLPPLPEQRRIVSKVDSLMSLCDELESRGTERVRLRECASRSCLARLLSSHSRCDLVSAWQRLSDHFEVLYDTPETLAHLRQSILRLAVQGKLVSQDPNDEPASELLESIARERTGWLKEKLIKKPKTVPPVTDDERNGVPPGWEMARLSNVIDARFTISYGVLVPGPDIRDGIPFVRIQDLAVRNPPEKPNKSIAPTVEEKYQRTRLVGGEILLGVVGSIGKLGIAPASWAGANIARAVCRIAAAPQIDRGYLVIVLGCQQTQDYFIHATRTLAQPTLNVGDVKKTLIPLPPLAEQKRIVVKVEQLLSQCDELSARLLERTSTLNEMMSSLISEMLGIEKVRPETKSMARKTTKAEPTTSKLKPSAEPVKTISELVDCFADVGDSATPDQLLNASRLGDDVDLFFRLLRTGRDSGVLEFSKGLNQPIRRVG